MLRILDVDTFYHVYTIYAIVMLSFPFKKIIKKGSTINCKKWLRNRLQQERNASIPNSYPCPDFKITKIRIYKKKHLFSVGSYFCYIISQVSLAVWRFIESCQPCWFSPILASCSSQKFRSHQTWSNFPSSYFN